MYLALRKYLTNLHTNTCVMSDNYLVNTYYPINKRNIIKTSCS